MYPVSERFLLAIAGSHRVAVRARAIPTSVPPQFVANPTDPRIIELGGLSAGGVKLSSTADINATGSVTVPGDYWEVLQPYGVEVFLERGVDFGDGSREYVPLGYYRVDEVTQESAPAGSVRVELSDRMAQLRDNRVLSPVQFEALTTHRAIFQRLVNGDSGGGQSTDGYGMYVHFPVPITWTAYDPDTTTIASALVCKDDAYKFLAELADAKGAVMRFDRLGRLEIVPRDRDPATPAIYMVRPGDGGTLVRASRKVIRDGVYNIVVARGSDPAAPTGYKVATNNDQASPLFWAGRFGPVPRYYASPLLRTDSAAADAAATVLARYKGLPASLSMLAVPAPHLDPLDVVAATIGATTATHLLDEVAVPLVGPEPITLRTRTLNEIPVDDETGEGPGDTPTPNPGDPGAPTPTVPPATQAAQLILARMNSGQPINPDWSWATMPAIADQYNEQLHDAWQATQDEGGSTPAVGGSTIFADSFESGNFSKFDSIQNASVDGQLDDPSQYEQDSRLKIVNGGSGHENAVRFELRDGDVVGTGERDELIFPSSVDVSEGDECWYEFDVKLGDPSWTSPNNWCLIWQWHHMGSTGSPPLSIETDGSAVKLFREGIGSPITLWTIRPGVWEHVVIGVRFSESGSGWFRVFVNGVEVVPQTSGQTLIDSGCYLKFGLYRDASNTITSVILYDHIKIGTALTVGSGGGGPTAVEWLQDYIDTHGGTPDPGTGTGAPIYPETFGDGTAYPTVTGAGAAAATNASALSALSSAANGTRVLLGSGSYSGDVTISGKQNLTIEAAAGATLNGKITVKDCNNVIVRGFTLPQDAPGDTIQFRGTSHHCALWDTKIGPASHPGSASSGEAGTYVFVGDDCHDIRIEWNELRNKSRAGNGIRVYGNFSSYKMCPRVLIAHNDLHDFYPAVVNDFEPIRYGVSTMSRTDAYGVIERNVFTNIKSEPEVISIKGGKIRATGNVLDKCSGSIVIRHGRGSVVADNYVIDGATTTNTNGEKSGGIRFYDDDHEIAYNTIQGTAGTTFQAALLIDTGDADASSTSLSSHFQIHRAKVHHNALAENETSIMVGDNYSKNPVDCVVTDNLVADSGAQAITYVNVPEGSIGTVSGNVYNATALGAGMVKDSDGVWRKNGYGSRLVFLKRANVGPAATAQDRLDGTGLSRTGGVTPTPDPGTPDPGTPAGSPGELHKIGVSEGNWFNLGVGFSPGDDYLNQTTSAVHRDILPAQLASGLVIPDYYEMNPAGDGVRMSAHLDGGKTSSNTKYPRTEYRQLNPDGSKAAWSTSGSPKELEWEFAVLRMPPNKPQLTIGQIHDGSDDVAVFRMESKTRFVCKYGDTEIVQDATTSFQFNQRYRCKLRVENNQIQWFFGNMSTPIATKNHSGSGNYFKLGTYAQSNKDTDAVEDGPFILDLYWLRCTPEDPR